MNKKGFTLVELLATIIILGLLALLASTSVTKVLKESKGDLYTTQIKLVESAVKVWGAENIDKLPDDNECKYLTIKNLQDYGLIDKDITLRILLTNSSISKPLSSVASQNIFNKLNF